MYNKPRTFCPGLFILQGSRDEETIISYGGVPMRKEDIYFESRDGATKLHAIIWSDEKKSPVGILQIIHGMAEYSDRYDDFAKYMVGKGYVVVGNDHLGHGDSVGENGTYGYFCKKDPATVLVRDAHRLKKIMEGKYPGVPYYILGHSMGSFVARNYLCRYGSGIQGMIVMGTGNQSKALLRVSKMIAGITGFFCGDKKVAKMINKLAFGTYNRAIENPKTNVDWLSKDEDIVEKYIMDERCGFTFTVNGFKGLFELIYRLQKPKNFVNIPRKIPVFFVSGEEDPVGDYGEGVIHAKNALVKAGLENVSMKLYPGDRHEILNETDREVVYNDIYEWLDSLKQV